MHSATPNRRQRVLAAGLVVLVHLMVAGWLLQARAPGRVVQPDPQAIPVYARIIEPPRPQPLGTPAPVKIALIPVTQPKIPTPEIRPIEIEALDAPAPGPDPAPSSAQLVTRPGLGNSGAQGYPAAGTQGLKLIRRVAPVFPPGSAQIGEAGVVHLGVRVDERGRVVEVKVLQGSGHDSQDDAAVNAVRKWKFEPLVQAGRAVSTWTQINVEMSGYQHNYCHIRDQPANAEGDDIREVAMTAVYPGDVALGNLLRELESGVSAESGPLAAVLRNWGPVVSIRAADSTGVQGWVRREVLPRYRSQQPEGSVLVKSTTYLVRHERQLSRWRVESDPSGKIWCAHFAPVQVMH